MRVTITAVLLLLLAAAPLLAGEARVEKMELDVKFFPAEHRMEGLARLQLAEDTKAGDRLHFRLHSGLSVTGLRLRDAETLGSDAVAENVDGYWRVVSLDIAPGAGPAVVTVRYAGTIYDAVRKSGALGFVVGDDTRGVIGEEGIFLVSGSGWYPLTEGTTAFRRL